MVRKIGVLVLIVVAIGGGAWYYINGTQHTKIETILSNPKSFEGKEVTIEGEVTDRTAFFPSAKFFRLKDKTGEIVVATQRSLPEIRSTIRAKGKIDDSFPVGDQKLVVFMAVSVEDIGVKK